jgi:acetyl esterase
MAVDQATTALLDQLAASGYRPAQELTPQQAREQQAAMRAQRGPGPELASVRDTRVRVSGGFVPLRVFTPAARDGGRPRGVLVYYHGGGWVLGTLDDFDLLARLLAQRTGCTVLLPGYRLAPEYRFPVAVDDAWAVLRWADEHRAGLTGAGDANGNGSNGAAAAVPLIVAGDSAGGNLAAVLAHRARTAGGPALALQVLVYPVTDCDLDTISYRDPANQLLLSRDTMTWFWDHYAPDPAARLHPDASPLRASDWSRLPPAAILTAEHDVLRDEGELYATRLMKAGIPVTLKRFAGQVHGFFTMVDQLPGQAAALDYVTAAITGQLAAATPALRA